MRSPPPTSTSWCASHLAALACARSATASSASAIRRATSAAAVQVLGSGTADLTAFVSMAPRTEQLARELFTYKNPNVRAEDRQWKTVGLAAVLWKWLGTHEGCLVNRLGSGGFDLITSVPSTSGRQSHPLRAIVAGVVSGSENRYADLLVLARGDLHNMFRRTTASAPRALSAALVY